MVEVKPGFRTDSQQTSGTFCQCSRPAYQTVESAVVQSAGLQRVVRSEHMRLDCRLCDMYRVRQPSRTVFAASLRLWKLPRRSAAYPRVSSGRSRTKAVLAEARHPAGRNRAAPSELPQAGYTAKREVRRAGRAGRTATTAADSLTGRLHPACRIRRCAPGHAVTAPYQQAQSPGGSGLSLNGPPVPAHVPGSH